ncbi:hypothetical protein [Bifidobacterium callimiconis]|uniref:Uncharacterized protein n=1 Tax=Bifidobacterium callimiconis TaxID=2306973 RepID=A0A430FIF4_9BIFI|nr:hypothetical protein [Bifidobacterium callimiconis]RSX52675.1 hypothetical protein D2E23_0403 [Bifidobacterium callimiconis]
MTRKRKLVQDQLIPDEITPVMLLKLSKKASTLKDCAAAFRIAVAGMLELPTKQAYIRTYGSIDAVTEALYDADQLAQGIIDAGFAIETMITKPLKSRELIMLDDLRRSLETDTEPDTGQTPGNVDPTTGEIH